MRFRRIEIPAYGPFIDFSAEFPGEGSDFHLVYGPNEAGKSSLLRAMRGFLFGIPAQTPDNFRHEYKKLCVLAELEGEDGQSRVFKRRKGNQNTLLDEDGSPVAEGELRAMLGAVDEAYFSSLFGLGSEELREGADELLRGEGRLGEALFSASLGGTPVDRVIAALEEEAGELFSGNAQRRIRTAIGEFKEHQKATKHHLIPPNAWKEVEEGLAEQDARLAELTTKRGEHRARREWLERCLGALSLVGQLADGRRQIEALAGLPELSRNFPERIREALAARDGAAREVEQLAAERLRLEKALADTSPRPDILAEATVIDRLHTDLGTYRETLRTVEAGNAEASLKEQGVTGMCRDLGIDVPLAEIEAFRVTSPRFHEAEQLAGHATAADEDVTALTRMIREREGELVRLRAEPDRDNAAERKSLSELVHRAAAVEPLAKTLDARTEALATLEAELRARHRELRGAPEDFEATSELPVPSRATIDRFREQIEENRRSVENLREEERKAGEEIRGIEAEIERYSRQRDLPSLDDLTASRERRDHRWGLVLEAWKGTNTGEDRIEGKPLEEAYPEAVVTADRIADRLREEAETVARMEECRAKLKVERERQTDLKTRVSEGQKEGEELAEQWKSAWEPCHLEPASPREMLEWRENWQEFSRKRTQWSQDRKQIATDREAVDAVTAALREALGSGSGDFVGSLAGVRERRDELDAARDKESARAAKIGELEADLKSARESLPESEEAHKKARAAWEACCEALRLSAPITPASSLEGLRSRREMFREYDSWRTLLQQIEEGRERANRFEEEVRALGTTLGIEATTTELQEAALWSALGEAEKARTAHDGFRDQIAEIDRRLAGARQALAAEEERFDGLFSQTGQADPAGLESFLSQVEKWWSHQDKVNEWRDHLAGQARGRPVDEFIEKVQAENPETLDEEIAELDET
ncbi:MAG: AAA family ATPase, partial [Verrucomicrobiaceae bacterium]|nr:AAA family ATPase [Verrucomicrobiaceae bacterium]